MVNAHGPLKHQLLPLEVEEVRNERRSPTPKFEHHVTSSKSRLVDSASSDIGCGELGNVTSPRCQNGYAPND
eukprot:3060463-Amphidinium_carterae.1